MDICDSIYSITLFNVIISLLQPMVEYLDWKDASGLADFAVVSERSLRILLRNNNFIEFYFQHKIKVELKKLQFK